MMVIDGVYENINVATRSEIYILDRVDVHSWQKRLLHPIEDNKTNVVRTFVFALG